MRPDLAHHPDDGPPVPAPNPSLARDIVFVLAVFAVGCVAPALALCVAVAG